MGVRIERKRRSRAHRTTRLREVARSLAHVDAARLCAVRPASATDAGFARAAALLRAAGDLARLRLLNRLDAGECCVTELADSSDAKLPTLSQQLRVLYAERMVKRRREAKHIYYSPADDHVRELLRAGLDHAVEPKVVNASPEKKQKRRKS